MTKLGGGSLRKKVQTKRWAEAAGKKWRGVKRKETWRGVFIGSS
jgi:hypothetical protein